MLGILACRRTMCHLSWQHWPTVNASPLSGTCTICCHIYRLVLGLLLTEHCDLTVLFGLSAVLSASAVSSPAKRWACSAHLTSWTQTRMES